jgi:hypothetical protein
MPKKSDNHENHLDLNQWAKLVVDVTTGDEPLPEGWIHRRHCTTLNDSEEHKDSEEKRTDGSQKER